MANYYSMSRTNYFAVTDENRFKEIIAKTSGESPVEWHKHPDANKYMFFCECNLAGIFPEGKDCDFYDNAYDTLIEELQKILPGGEAIILTTVGYEKMRYLTADALIITNKEAKSIFLDEEAKRYAKEILERGQQ